MKGKEKCLVEGLGAIHSVGLGLFYLKILVGQMNS